MNLTQFNAQFKLKERFLISTAMNMLLVLLEVIGLVKSYQTHGFSLFSYYTEDSNLLALIACFMYSFFAFKAIKKGSFELPKWILLLKYVSACCLAVTFFVVIFVLANVPGSPGLVSLLFSGSMLYHHFVCPVLAVISVIFLEMNFTLLQKSAFLALMPTILYAIVSVILNITRLMTGPYPFLHVYEQPFYVSVIWVIVILGIAFLVAVLIRICCNKYLPTFQKSNNLP